MCKMMLNILLLLGLKALFTPAKGEAVQYYCGGHSPQNQIALDLLMGRWYIIEIVEHLDQEKYSFVPTFIVDDCPVIRLLKQDEGNYRVLWTEKDLNIYYAAKRGDPKVDGYWIASGPHNETYVDHSGLSFHYTGTIEVMKAVSNHAVLTFCISDHLKSQLFSAVLSRDRWLPRSEIRGVNNMLRGRNLRHVLIKKLCNGATNLMLPSYALAIATLIKFISLSGILV